MSRIVFGIGINDADYTIKPTINGKVIPCKIYRAWCHMLERCYYPQYRERHPSYLGCTVCDEWLIFSNFKKWMVKQNWEGKHLDKDLLTKGNKIYSPETCVFITPTVNGFITDEKMKKGCWPTGVYWNSGVSMLVSQCRNPFTKKREHLGLFSNEREAYLAWKKRKHELACKLAEIQDDHKVSLSLRNRYI